MYAASHDRLHAPAPILKQLSEAGLTGRKSGRGFYTYEAPGSRYRRAGRADPAGRRPRRSPAARSRSVGVAGSGTMASGIAEVFAKAGLRGGAGRPQPGEGGGGQGPHRQVAGPLGRQGPDDGRGRATRRWPGSPRPARSTPSPTSTWRWRPWPRTWRSSRQLFATLDKVCKPGAVLATTTSSLPVVACARATSRPQDVIGMHFFNPAPAMKLVEVVRTVLTADDVHATVREVCAKVTQAPGGLRRPGRLHRERAAVPVPEQRDQDGPGALRVASTTSTPR